MILEVRVVGGVQHMSVCDIISDSSHRRAAYSSI